MKRRDLAGTLLTLGVLAFLAADSTLYFARIDVTDHGIYSFSAVTRNLYKSVSEPVEITYYVSDRLRKISPVPQQVEDVLAEYATLSHGRIHVRSIDPERVGVDLSESGIVAEQMEIVNDDERTSANVYSGIEVEYLDRHDALPFVSGTDDLEYALTSTLKKLIEDRDWQAGILVGERGRTVDGDYSLLAADIGRFYDLRILKPGEPVPRSLGVLLVLGGADLDKEDLRPIDRFVMGGGEAIFCAPGVSVDTTSPELAAKSLDDTPLDDLLASYGVRVPGELVLDANAKDFRTVQEEAGQYLWRDLGPYPFWIDVRKENVAADNPVTRNFEGLDLLWTSPLVPLDVPGVHYQRLVESSPSAWLMKGRFSLDPADATSYDAVRDEQPPGQYTLAYALSGRFPSYFPDKAGERSAPTRLIVVGSDDFASDLLRYSDSAYNLTFLANAVDWLSGNGDLLAIKEKSQWDPRLDKIEDPGEKARTFRFAEFVNIGLVPLVVVVFALRRAALRRKLRQGAGT